MELEKEAAAAPKPIISSTGPRLWPPEIGSCAEPCARGNYPAGSSAMGNLLCSAVKREQAPLGAFFVVSAAASEGCVVGVPVSLCRLTKGWSGRRCDSPESQWRPCRSGDRQRRKQLTYAWIALIINNIEHHGNLCFLSCVVDMLEVCQ